MNQKKISVALVSNDKIGKMMAGPGIRYFELAKTFSKFFKVTLFVPDNCDISSADFKIIVYNSKKQSSSIANSLLGIDVILAQSLRPPLLRVINNKKIKFIADLYDPLIIEMLEYTKLDPERIRKNIYDFNYHTLLLQLNTADHILCSSEKQKDLYIGLLSREKRVTPNEYSESPDLKNLISILPFGTPCKKFEKINADSLENKFPQIKRTDTLIYWGGGIWNWFDPITVVKAIENISKKRKDIKLLFLGTAHPNPKIKTMEMVQRTVDFCKEKDLLDKVVFFNFGWTPYEERVKYLSRADIAISTHFKNLETRFSFRTRILDYLWASIPMIVTKGDVLSEFINDKNLGKVVGYESVNEIEEAILQLADEKIEVQRIKKNIEKINTGLSWDNAASSTISVISNNLFNIHKINWLKFVWLSFNFYLSGSKKKLMRRINEQRK